MENNNKNRLLLLLKILRTRSDMNHKLSLSDIVSYLSEEGIQSKNRKTLYDDFKILNENGYCVEYDNGYYLEESPFCLSEIKIILDSINSLKNLDIRFLNNLKEKLYSFVSVHEKELLCQLEYQHPHYDSKFIHRLEDVLEAIRLHQNLIIQRKDKEKEEISPLFLYRNNDFYYLYYHYPKDKRIYHMRFDNILNALIATSKEEITISREEILSHIEESSNSFYNKKAELLEFTIQNDSILLRNRLSNDFPNIIYTKDGFSIKASISNVFYSKLTAYGNDIQIKNKEERTKYYQYLENIIHNN